MSNMAGKQILVTIPMTQQQRERLEKEAQDGYFSYEVGEEIREESVQKANIILGAVPASMIQASENLEWLHSSTAGVDPYLADGVLQKKTILTNSRGAYGKAVSEHMFAMLIAMQKKLHLYRDDQKKHIWGEEGEVTSISDAVVLILGAGDIGCHFAKMAHALGAYVIGVKRSPGECPEYMDELRLMKDLEALLPKADAVVSFLPSTEETRGLFDKKLFGLMKKGSFFVNGGRGELVCTEDLCDALESGHLAGAALDVTNPEPLPGDHRLWEIPNAFVTPHISGYYHLPETLRNVVSICTENVRRYAEGMEVLNRITH